MLGIRWSIKRIWMLGILTSMSSICFGGITDNDELLLGRMFDYRRNYAADVSDSTRNIYMRCHVDVERRNPALMLVPSLYSISRGKRQYLGESYGSIKFKDIRNFNIQKELQLTTIPHNREIMPTIAHYLLPDIYGMELIDGNVLSPFNRHNTLYYFYRVSEVSHLYSLVTFIPRARSTQLVKGFALVDNNTGRIINAKLTGEYDMIAFTLSINMGQPPQNTSILPMNCQLTTQFRFVGNKVKSEVRAQLTEWRPLPDSLMSIDIKKAMAYVRPYQMTHNEKTTYMEALGNDTTNNGKSERNSKWEFLGEHLFNSHKASNDKASVRLSPLLNPLYFSYSGHRGLAYHLKLGSTWAFNDESSITFTPKMGYNFKIKQFFYDTPLRFIFNKRHQGWMEAGIANGNKISSIDMPDMLFDDLNSHFSINYMPWRKMQATATLRYHRRTSDEEQYNSFAPSITLTYTPSKTMPTFSVNYERSIKGPLRSNMEYEKIEMDASYKRKMQMLRILNIRAGYGLYTNRKTSQFIDFANFHENYLPDGWDDEWAGEFQLLKSRWYNTSTHYFRANASYEAPLMLLAFIPKIGKHLESERIYLGIANLSNTRPYTELGYGVKSRYISAGLFAGFLNQQVQEVGAKLTVELFSKW